jgi:hypothetical protein
VQRLVHSKKTFAGIILGGVLLFTIAACAVVDEFMEGALHPISRRVAHPGNLIQGSIASVSATSRQIVIGANDGLC